MRLAGCNDPLPIPNLQQLDVEDKPRHLLITSLFTTDESEQPVGPEEISHITLQSGLFEEKAEGDGQGHQQTQQSTTLSPQTEDPGPTQSHLDAVKMPLPEEETAAAFPSR